MSQVSSLINPTSDVLKVGAARNFSEGFLALTGCYPFPWQAALFSELAEGRCFRRNCDLPTGLGKTSIIAIWLLALAHHARSGALAGFPRRLVYVVNRRTV